MKFSSQRGRRWVAVIAGVSAATGQVKAFDPADLMAFQAGPVEIKPHVSVSEQYSDNVFYMPSALQPRDDFITTIAPGLSLGMGKEDITANPFDINREQANFISVDYTAPNLVYAKQTELDTTEHLITIKDRIKWQRLKIEGTDSIQFLSSPLAGGYGYLFLSIPFQNINQTAYANNYRLEYAISEKTSVYVAGAHSATYFQSGLPLYDVDTLTATTGFSWKVFPKAEVFGEGYYGQTAILPSTPNLPGLPDSPHLNIIGGFVGMRGNFTEKLTGMVKVGYEATSFSDGTPAPASPVVGMTLIQKFSEKTSLELDYSRKNNPTFQAAGSIFTADNVMLQFSQVIGATGKFTASAGGMFESDSYGAEGAFPNRQDYWYRANAMLTYHFKLWMTG
ncbi:MAG: hypothetical protein KGS61_05160, partial [Verrucomicrobia bacterium]|nr:hypothetical protein [Verrucomicrobiota bacterium]